MKSEKTLAGYCCMTITASVAFQLSEVWRDPYVIPILTCIEGVYVYEYQLNLNIACLYRSLQCFLFWHHKSHNDMFVL